MSRLTVALPAEAGQATLVECDVRCVLNGSITQDNVHQAYLVDGPGLQGGEDGLPHSGVLAAAAGVALPAQGAGRARTLLAAGARRVLLGDAALEDASLIATLAGEFGAQRVGVYVPARRFEVSWSFDAVSNADFKVLTPSVAAPAWEILRADGTRTGTQALWWIGAMLKSGATEVLLRVDIEDDADLNLCADCQERFAARVWIGPLERADPQLPDWVRYGHARQLALPPELFAKVQAQDAAVAAAAAAGAGQRAA